MANEVGYSASAFSIIDWKLVRATYSSRNEVRSQALALVPPRHFSQAGLRHCRESGLSVDAAPVNNKVEATTAPPRERVMFALGTYGGGMNGSEGLCSFYGARVSNEPLDDLSPFF